jgi:hypothetical protein
MDEAVQHVPPNGNPEKEVMSMGLTDDYAWYELSVMKNQAAQLASRMENMERVLKRRSEEQYQYVRYLERKMGELQKRLNEVKEQAHE